MFRILEVHLLFVLISKPELLRLREIVRNPIDSPNKFSRFLPNL